MLATPQTLVAPQTPGASCTLGTSRTPATSTAWMVTPPETPPQPPSAASLLMVPHEAPPAYYLRPEVTNFDFPGPVAEFLHVLDAGS